MREKEREKQLGNRDNVDKDDMQNDVYDSVSLDSKITDYITVTCYSVIDSISYKVRVQKSIMITISQNEGISMQFFSSKTSEYIYMSLYCQ